MKRTPLAIALATVVAFNTTARAQQGGSQSAPTPLTFEQALQYEVDLEPALLVLLDAEREVLEVDEHRGRELVA